MRLECYQLNGQNGPAESHSLLPTLFFDPWLTQLPDIENIGRVALPFTIVLCLLVVAGVFISVLRLREAAWRAAPLTQENVHHMHRALFDGIHVPAAGFDDQLRVTWINETALSLLKVTHFSEVVGKSFDELFVTTTGKDILKRRMNEIPLYMVAQGKECYSIEIPVLDMAQQYHELLVSVQSVRDCHGLLVGFVAIGQDITEAKTGLVRGMDTSDQWIKAMAGGLAHDLNNLFGIADGNMRLLAESPDLSPRQERFIQDAQSAISDAISLCKADLERSKGRTPSLSEVDIQQVMRDTESFVRTLLPSEVTVIFAPSPEPRFIWTDKAKLLSALLNLIKNAAEATGGASSREVWVSAAWEDHSMAEPSLTVTVKDNGGGVPAGELNRVKMAFYSTKTGGSGAGLGLTMVDEFCRESGGKLEFRSSPDVGTCVSMILPRRPISPARFASPGAGGQNNSRGRFKAAPWRVAVGDYDSGARH